MDSFCSHLKLHFVWVELQVSMGEILEFIVSGATLVDELSEVLYWVELEVFLQLLVEKWVLTVMQIFPSLLNF